MAFEHQTLARLQALLSGFGPAAILVLLAGGMIQSASYAPAATLCLMGIGLGVPLRMALGWLAQRFDLQPAERLLPVLAILFFLPLAALPVQPGLLAPSGSWRGFTSFAFKVLAGFPLGVALGAVVECRSLAVASRSWAAAGAGLGALLAAGAVAGFSVLRGASLIDLFAAPMVWPLLPAAGRRSLLARMMLTLAVVLACLVILYL